jgi:DNA invertase Pin-like site-specific DNA recombinase
MIRAYLRASTNEQDANRAKQTLEEFVTDHQQRVAAWYVENESGRNTERGELRRLLDDSHAGDVLLVESVDRLTRLPANGWRNLKQDIEAHGMRVVAVDLPSTHAVMRPSEDIDELTQRILEATNSMLLEIVAAQAAADYDKRRERQSQGIEKAKRQGKYRGRPIDTITHTRVAAILRDGHSIRRTAELAGVSPSTVQRVKKASLSNPN